MLNIGIIGCGLIGKKRANSISQINDVARLVACADVNINRANLLASEYQNVSSYDSWQVFLEHSSLDVVIVSTLHDSLSEITSACIKANKHVLVEKPAARSKAELLPVMKLADVSNVKVRVGFNHRYHRAFQKAKAIIQDGKLGELMFIRARYGHGARIGYENEWRANPSLSGGGELIDQGPHLIDLSQWLFEKPLNFHSGSAHTYFWDMPVDDNGFMLLKTAKKQVAFLHASCTEWKNLFSMEIYGKDGKLDLSGLGGSYGIEQITHYRMLPEMGPPETKTWEYPMGDNSWELEMNDFYKDISRDREPSAGLIDAYEALKIIQNIYLESDYDYSS